MGREGEEASSPPTPPHSNLVIPPFVHEEEELKLELERRHGDISLGRGRRFDGATDGAKEILNDPIARALASLNSGSCKSLGNMVKFLRSGCLDHRMFGNGHPLFHRDELLSKKSVGME